MTTPRLTPAQADALRYVRAVTSTGLPVPVTPRRDVLQRLAGLGLVTRTVTAHREPSQDRWRHDAAHTLTATGLQALEDLDAWDENPELSRHNLRSAAARRTVRRAR